MDAATERRQRLQARVYRTRAEHERDDAVFWLGGVPVSFIGRGALIRNERATGRARGPGRRRIAARLTGFGCPQRCYPAGLREEDA